MNTSNLGIFAVAGSIAFVGALAVGVPLSTLAPALILLACPLMMIFMMKGMHGGGHEHHDADEHHDPRLHH